MISQTLVSLWEDRYQGLVELSEELKSEVETMKEKNLEQLMESMKSNSNWSSDQPTFGGKAPADTSEVWSWDKTRLLVGTCADDLEIVDREDW